LCPCVVNTCYFLISAAEISKPAEKDPKTHPEIHPKNLADLDSRISTLAIAAVAAYGDAAGAVRGQWYTTV
jgi:hypothetical protein